MEDRGCLHIAKISCYTKCIQAYRLNVSRFFSCCWFTDLMSSARHKGEVTRLSELQLRSLEALDTNIFLHLRGATM